MGFSNRFILSVTGWAFDSLLNVLVSSSSLRVEWKPGEEMEGRASSTPVELWAVCALLFPPDQLTLQKSHSVRKTPMTVGRELRAWLAHVVWG